VKSHQGEAARGPCLRNCLASNQKAPKKHSLLGSEEEAARCWQWKPPENITCIHEIRDSHPGSILTSRDPEIHLSIVAQFSQQEAFLLGLAKRHGCLHIEQEFCTISDVEEHW